MFKEIAFKPVCPDKLLTNEKVGLGAIPEQQEFKSGELRKKDKLRYYSPRFQWNNRERKFICRKSEKSMSKMIERSILVDESTHISPTEDILKKFKPMILSLGRSKLKEVLTAIPQDKMIEEFGDDQDFIVKVIKKLLKTTVHSFTQTSNIYENISQKTNHEIGLSKLRGIGSTQQTENYNFSKQRQSHIPTERIKQLDNEIEIDYSDEIVNFYDQDLGASDGSSRNPTNIVQQRNSPNTVDTIIKRTRESIRLSNRKGDLVEEKKPYRKETSLHCDIRNRLIPSPLGIPTLSFREIINSSDLSAKNPWCVFMNSDESNSRKAINKDNSFISNASSGNRRSSVKVLYARKKEELIRSERPKLNKYCDI